MKKSLLFLLISSALTYQAEAVSYKDQLQSLEDRISNLEKTKATNNKNYALGTAIQRRLTGDNKFNPAISLIVNGQYSKFSEKEPEILGFAIGEEGARGEEGLSLGETELNISTNIDDKFYGSVTAALVKEDGEDKLELEESFIQTLNAYKGFSLKAGKFFATIGYLNQQHKHADNFADRPLPYRIFLNSAFNDTGIEVSYLLPTPIYAEIGYGLFRGDDFPAGNAGGEGANAATGYIRIGGDLTANTSWRLGGSILNSKTINRESNEDEVAFAGKNNIAILDLKFSHSFTGNRKNNELIIQSEYFQQEEDGKYTTDGITAAVDRKNKGFYGELIYKFTPNYRIGYRYAKLSSAKIAPELAGTILDSQNHNPYVNSIMLDWTNSEYARVRLQYNEDKASVETDNQVILQYIMSLGAHAAHNY
jgi:hypothetical protein